jgi:hypothetical protein
MPSGVTTLGGLARLRSGLDVACNRCDRRGRLSVRRLLAEHGPDLPVPELRRIIAADCPKMIEGKMHDVCGIHFPGLAG